MRFVGDEDSQKLFQRAKDAEDAGRTAFPGMSYEQGIIAAFDYLEGNLSLDEALPEWPQEGKDVRGI